MSRLIDTDALLEALGDAEYDVNGGMYGDDGYSYGFLYDFIKKQETIEPVKHAHWIVHAIKRPIYVLVSVECSECHEEFDYGSKYCPYCGSKMDSAEQTQRPI